MTKLVICEKQDAAKRIASALGSYKVKRVNKVDVFMVKDYIVCYASGHLYNLASNARSYPIFNPIWKPRSKKAYMLINTIKGLAKHADTFINACDFDQEGEVIAYNILTYACNNSYSKAYRAIFSELTNKAIINAFNNLEPNHKYKGLADAGRARHMLDFIYGINLSRALIDASKSILSIGRVQGPTLAFIIDREIEIRTFIPRPYWLIYADLEKDGIRFKARYESIVYNAKDANTIRDRCKGKDGIVKSIDERKHILKPPYPFNLLDLQRECYKYLRLSPSKTLDIAERLYLNALISYPRTSSQILPKMDYRSIINSLSKVSRYKEQASILLAKPRLNPNNGSKQDPAHPAIYPTGELARNLSKVEYKVYDLIVRRFLATFMDAAIINIIKVIIDINGYNFIAEGRSVEKHSWLKYYGSYDEYRLPNLNLNDEVKNLAIISKEDFTKPKPRFNASSLLALMEEQRIGTKSTRAMIIDTLLKRGYINSRFEPTELGFGVFEIMQSYMPEILSVDLTRSMEDMLDAIEQGRVKASKVISIASERLIEALNSFEDNREAISARLNN